MVCELTPQQLENTTIRARFLFLRQLFCQTADCVSLLFSSILETQNKLLAFPHMIVLLFGTDGSQVPSYLFSPRGRRTHGHSYSLGSFRPATLLTPLSPPTVSFSFYFFFFPQFP